MNEEPDYINFGDMARSQLGQQCQYASRYATNDFAELGWAFLGEGLRIKGEQANYHFLEIHRDDVETFIARWEKETNCKRTTNSKK